MFLYVSATVLIAARLNPFVLAEISETAIFGSWRQVMEALNQYSVHGASIERLSTTLTLLFDTVPRQFSRVRQVPNETVDQILPGELANTANRMVEGQLYNNTVGEARPPSPSLFDRGVTETNFFHFDSDDFVLLTSLCDSNDMSWLTTAPFEM